MQSEELHAFLVAEAALTAKTQHEVTLKLGAETKNFKARTTQAAEAASAAIKSWVAALTVEQVLTMPGNLYQAFQREAADAIAPWAELFRQAGFDPGGRPGYDYRNRRDARPWQFYNPRTGTARSEQVPTGEAFEVLRRALDDYRESISAVKSAEKARDAQAAADLWDS